MKSIKTVLKVFNFLVILALALALTGGKMLPEAMYYMIASWQIGGWSAAILKWLNRLVDGR